MLNRERRIQLMLRISIQATGRLIKSRLLHIVRLQCRLLEKLDFEETSVEGVEHVQNTRSYNFSSSNQ